MLKNEISIQHRVASAAFSPVTHVVATPRDAFSIHAANTAHSVQLHRTTVWVFRAPSGGNGRSCDRQGPFLPKGTRRLFVLLIDPGCLSRILVDNHSVLLDFSLHNRKRSVCRFDCILFLSLPSSSILDFRENASRMLPGEQFYL